MSYITLLAAHVVCVLVILLAVFLRRRGLRPVAVIAGALALWLPLLSQLETLGAPSPQPPSGDYRVISSKMSESEDILYLFVDAMETDFTPRVYQIPFKRDKYERLRAEGDYAGRVLRIQTGEGGTYEVVYVDYEPPDLLKDGVMRGWRSPRPEDQ